MLKDLHKEESSLAPSPSLTTYRCRLLSKKSTNSHFDIYIHAQILRSEFFYVLNFKILLTFLKLLSFE